MPETPVQVFTAAELAELHSLSDPEQIKAAQIMGQPGSWDLFGHINCGWQTAISGYLNARGRVNIGKYCAIGRYVSIHAGNHRTDLPNQQVAFNRRHGFVSAFRITDSVDIGHNVWIGDKANVLAGVKIGHGAVVAAGATVINDVPPFAIVGGVPGKVLRYRFSEPVIAQMLKIAWWHWSEERIKRNVAFFETATDHNSNVDLMSIVVE